MAVTHEIRTSNGGTRMVRITPMKAIRYFCTECMNWQPTLITKCTAPLCPLYPYRNGKRPSDATDEETDDEAIEDEETE